MKVKFYDKRLWKEYYGFLSVISVIASFLFLFIEIPIDKKIACFIAFIFSLQ